MELAVRDRPAGSFFFEAQAGRLADQRLSRLTLRWRTLGFPVDMPFSPEQPAVCPVVCRNSDILNPASGTS
jgi:hypothetical protein